MNRKIPFLSSSEFPLPLSERKIEIWGGLECTVTRVGDTYRDQIEETGHGARPEDLDSIAALGLRTLRYPVLWETVSPDHPDRCNWQWHDERLNQLRALEISPIAGLIHHGSGPRYTSLLDPAFPELLARHAARVAERYPWIKRYTPVNEPLTTARFAGLYGHWYPHGKDTATFLRALLNQCRAVVLCMQAIRRVRPDAELVQTDDLGKVFSTPRLQYQADYENQRRWLGFDLLCGRVNRFHPWHRHFLGAGIGDAELRFFSEQRCAPDIIGINHYLTSERFLDHRIEHYPHHHHAGNGRDRYADAEAVRIEMDAGETGPYARLAEAWERYRLPIAVTEVHHGCTRDEQLRWLMDVYGAASRLRSEGADIRAITVWSMLGAVDWNSLLVQRNGDYEPGIFDVRRGTPRPTALARATEALARHGEFDHPVLDQPGWWRRDGRHYHGLCRPEEAMAGVCSGPPAREPRRLLITGATGTLGSAFSRICGLRGLDHDLLKRADMDIADQASVEAALARLQPWAVINTAGYVRVADAANEPERCFRENASGAEIMARACVRLGIPLVTFSSDLVFDGCLGRAYLESDVVSPQCVYGNSKAEAERLVLQAWPQALVIRSSAFFGPWDRYNFLHGVLRGLSAGQQVCVSDATMVSPTYVPDLVHAVLDLLIDGESGVWHLANQGVTSWHGLAERAAMEAGVDAGGLIRTSADDRRITALSSERGLILPSLEGAIQRYVRDNTMEWNIAAATRQRSVFAAAG